MTLLTRATKRRFATETLRDGTVVRLRSLLRAEQRQWKHVTRGPAAENYSDDVLLALCICDEDGNQIITCDDALTGIFDSWDMGECQQLLRAAIQLCFPSEVADLNGEVRAAIKNLRPTSGNGSSGDSVSSEDARATN